MAVAKKSSKKSRPVTTKKPAPKPATSRIAKKAARALTADERRKLLKPRADYDDVIERAVRVWAEHGKVKVPDLTSAKLTSLLKRAQAAAAREEVVRQRFELKIRPLQDARLLAEDTAYRKLLDLNAAVKVFARNDPAVAEAFAFLGEFLTGVREPAEPSGGGGGDAGGGAPQG